MVEALENRDLGPGVDENGNLLSDEIASGMSLDEAFWKLERKDQQKNARPYIELFQHIEELPDFEKNSILKFILEFLSKQMSEQDASYRDYGIVQYFSRSSQPLSFWENCEFNTGDGKFELYLNDKIRPAVEGMLDDLGESHTKSKTR